jgi:hypothetical protein
MRALSVNFKPVEVIQVVRLAISYTEGKDDVCRDVFELYTLDGRFICQVDAHTNESKITVY